MEKVKVIEVVDTEIFQQKLQMADAILPFVLSLLTTQKAVSNFLEKSSLTIANMVKDKRLKEGVHYIKEGGSIVFIPLAIIDYKLNPPSFKPKTKEAYEPSQEAREFLS
jgi:hypothetical protein